MHAKCGGLAMGLAVHTDMATPPILAFGSEEQKQAVPRAGDPRREDLLPRDHRARRRLGRRRHPHAREAGRRRLRHQRLEDVHHERPPRRLHRPRHEDRPRRRLRRLHAVPRRHGPPRRHAREAPREARDARLGHRAARVPGRPRPVVRRRSARSARASTTSCGSSRASGSSARRAASRAPSGCSTRRSRYAKERTAFGRPIGGFQVTRHKFAEMATKIETARQMVYTTAWRFMNGEYPVREISMAKLHAARVAVEVADECIQIHGGAGYMKEYGDRARLARHAPQPHRRRHRRDHARGDRPLVRALDRRLQPRLHPLERGEAPLQRRVGRTQPREPRARAAAGEC